LPFQRSDFLYRNDSDSKREHDFLSSIEMCIIDEADTMGMQNWDHLITVMQAMNKTPEQTHETDFSRVRDAFLNGQYVQLCERYENH
jgi:U3 small nucleolar RNA-associated protein 25